MSKVSPVVVAVFLGVLIGGVAYAQSDTPKFSKELFCSSLSVSNCLEEPYAAKQWKACAYEAAVNIQGCLGSKNHACTTRSMKITELAVERTRYGPLFTLLVSGMDGNERGFRYTANCHVSKAGELIEFKTVQLR